MLTVKKKIPETKKEYRNNEELRIGQEKQVTN
jgi:hypothetical protein